MFFGPQHRPLFGWLHRAEPQRARPIGLLICNPFGYEAVCAHRTLRHLAVQAAAAGFSTMRFDYDGSGDSAGSEIDPQRLTAWIASIHAAIDMLRSATGVDSVCLVGLRLGATLAALAAATRADVAGLIGVATVTKPRAYLRELRALALAREQPTPPAWAEVNPDIQDIAGFALANATSDELSSINLLTVPHASVPDVLLMYRNDLPHDTAWAQRLEELGTRVRQQAFGGYAEMMLDAHENVVADELNSAILTWLPALQPTRSTPLPQVAFDSTTLIEDGAVRERALRIGADDRLFAIAAEPASMTADDARHIVVFLNAGAVTHIGPNRLHVKLARHLARHATVSLRVDVSGIGESPPYGAEPENHVYAARIQQDLVAIRAYIDARYPNAEVSLVGLCSGAYHAFKCAVGGMRLRQIFAINPLTFFWKEGMVLAVPEFQVVAAAARYRTVAFELDSWLRALRGEADLLGAVKLVLRRVRLASRNAVRSIRRTLCIPMKEDLGVELQRAARHQVQLVFVFAESDPGRQLLFGQGGSVVGEMQRREALHMEIVEAADHTFTRHWAQARLMAILSRHLGVPSLR